MVPAMRKQLNSYPLDPALAISQLHLSKSSEARLLAGVSNDELSAVQKDAVRIAREMHLLYIYIYMDLCTLHHARRCYRLGDRILK